MSGLEHNQNQATNGETVRLSADDIRVIVNVYDEGRRPRWGPDGHSWSWWVYHLARAWLEDDAAVEARIEALEERDKWPPCACSYDAREDVCAVHSPVVAKVTEALRLACNDGWADGEAAVRHYFALAEQGVPSGGCGSG